jgi:hypothetical protein
VPCWTKSIVKWYLLEKDLLCFGNAFTSKRNEKKKKRRKSRSEGRREKWLKKETQKDAMGWIKKNFFNEGV